MVRGDKTIKLAFADGIVIMGEDRLSGITKVFDVTEGAVAWYNFVNVSLASDRVEAMLYLYTDDEGYYEVITEYYFISEREAKRWVSITKSQGSIVCAIPDSKRFCLANRGK